MPPKRIAESDPAPLSQEDRVKEQNRAHQKLFRERRKEKMKLLEERVAELERELQNVRSASNSTSEVLVPTASSSTLGGGATANDTRRRSDSSMQLVSPNDGAPLVNPATHARIMSLEAENFALKSKVVRQQQQLQSSLNSLPRLSTTQPSLLSFGVPSSNTNLDFLNPYITLPLSSPQESWHDLINIEDGGHTGTHSHFHFPTLLPSAPLHHPNLLIEIVSAANQMLQQPSFIPTRYPECDDAKNQFLSIPSLSTRTETVINSCKSFMDLCLYASSLSEAGVPDPIVQGNLLLDLIVTSYHTFEACKLGEERVRALNVYSDLRYDTNRQFKVLVARHMPSLFLINADPVGISKLPSPLITQETVFFYQQCMQIPSLNENPFVGRLFDGAKYLLANYESADPEGKGIAQSRCFWYQYYMHVLIPLLCPAPDRLRLEYLVDEGRIERKVALDDLVETLDRLELKL